jgi:hypothetical protein
MVLLISSSRVGTPGWSCLFQADASERSAGRVTPVRAVVVNQKTLIDHGASVAAGNFLKIALNSRALKIVACCFTDD